MNSASTATTVELSGDAERRLRLTNGVFGIAHLVSGIAMVALSNDFSLPVTTNFLEGPPGQGVGELTVQFDVRLGWATAGFLFLSALFHLIVVTIGWDTYRNEIRHHRNRFRWVEYSLSSSLMIVLIAQLTGISDLSALIAIAGVNAAMILFGWLMEVANPADRTSTWWTPFNFGCIAGVVPWLAVGVYLLGPGGDVPGFVYGIFVSLFLLFNCFAVNQVLQYRGNGRWSDYVFGEQVYVWLSIIAKSVLAWQIFANTLVA